MAESMYPGRPCAFKPKSKDCNFNPCSDLATIILVTTRMGVGVSGLRRS
jgi:hypothetical protein